MVLGSSETLGTQSNLFTTVDPKLKIYRRVTVADVNEPFNYPIAFSPSKISVAGTPPSVRAVQNIQTLTDQLMLQQFSPTGVLVNTNGDIIYISGHIGKYLEPAVGKANMNIFAMLMESLSNDFAFAFRQSVMKKETVVLQNIKAESNGGSYTLDVTIKYLQKPEALHGMIMVIFKEVPASSNLILTPHSEINTLPGLNHTEMAKELKIAREKLQATLEEMQTSEEELKSTNEELQFTNEELQSTNEEVISSKEEMQSMNEELQTLNTELQLKVDDFTNVSNDMKNLLNSTDIATVFLDLDLKIRRYTFQATKIFKLIKSDIGRPITDLVSDLIYPGLEFDALTVLKSLLFIKKQMLTTDGRWFSIRIMPYRTFDDKADGLVITFFNITDLKQTELKLQENEQLNRLLFDTSPDVLIRLSNDWKIVDFNPQAENYFGKKRGDVLNQNYIQKLIPEKVRKKTQNDLKKLLLSLEENTFRMQTLAAGGKQADELWSVFVIVNSLKIPTGMILLLRKNLKK